jgi:hypothetical protein
MIAGGVAMTTKMIAGGVTTKKKTSKTPHGINAMMSIPVLLTPVTEMLTWLKLKSLAFKTSGLLQIQFPTSGSWYSCTHGFSLFGSEQAHHILYQINLKFNVENTFIFYFSILILYEYVPIFIIFCSHYIIFK